MTAPLSPSRYPPEFEAALLRAAAEGELFIPSGAPKTLRAKIWNYQKALRASGRAELADSVSLHAEPTGLRIRRRSLTLEGREVAAALNSPPPGDSPPAASDPAESVFERLLK